MGAPSATPATDRAVHGLALATLGLLLFLSPMALAVLGWNYDAPGGGAGPMRFHPSSFTIVLLFAALALRDGNPLASVGRQLGEDPRIVLFLLVFAITLYHGVANQKLPAAGLVDSFLVPCLAVVTFRRLEDCTRRALETLLHVGLALNALVGVAEFVLGFRVTPYVAGGIAITDDWRSTAFLGHPLSNAMVSGCYTAILLMGGGSLSSRARLWLILLQLAGMIVFGGRVSTALLALFLLARMGRAGYRMLSGARIGLPIVATVAMVIPIALGALGVLFELGFFDKFLLRFVEDNNSANARIRMLELYSFFSWTELLFGPSQEVLAHAVRLHRLEFGIESLWVAFSLYYGVLPGMVFLVGFVCFLFALAQQCQPRVWWIIGYIMVLNTTFLGLAGKSIHFTTLVLAMLVLFPARPPRPAPGTLPSKPLPNAPQARWKPREARRPYAAG